MATLARNAGDGRKTGARTKNDITAALCEYAARYGQPTTAAFNPSTAKWRDEPVLIERYYAGRANGDPWPSLNSIKDVFDGSFNDALEAAGLPRNRPGPAPGHKRRAAGAHSPDRTVREHRVLIPSERHLEMSRKLSRAEQRALRAESRVSELRERAERAEEKFAIARDRNLALRAAGVVEAAPPRPAPRTVTKTKTKTVRVRDERAVERLRAQLSDERAARRAVVDQLRAATRDLDRARGEAGDASSRLVVAVQEAQAATRARNRAEDRLLAVEDRVGRLQAELTAAREVTYGAAEAAQTSELVRAAEDRVELAEERAARAERVAAEHAAAATGHARILTRAELDALRTSGPAGPIVMADALKLLARARKGRGNMDAALTAVMTAAQGWKDLL